MYLDNHLRIGGTYNNPVVDGNIKVNKDTKFTIVMHSLIHRLQIEKVLLNLSTRQSTDDSDQARADEALSNLEITGINAVNIEVDKDAELSIVIDKSNGDFLN
jgi:ribosomal protein L5